MFPSILAVTKVISCSEIVEERREMLVLNDFILEWLRFLYQKLELENSSSKLYNLNYMTQN